MKTHSRLTTWVVLPQSWRENLLSSYLNSDYYCRYSSLTIRRDLLTDMSSYADDEHKEIRREIRDIEEALAWIESTGEGGITVPREVLDDRVREFTHFWRSDLENRKERLEKDLNRMEITSIDSDEDDDEEVF